MPGRTKFSEKWLDLEDPNKHKLSLWCSQIKDDPFSARCRICNKNVAVYNQGYHQLFQHASTKIHKDNAKDKLSPKNFFLTGNSSETNSVVTPTPSSSTNSVKNPTPSSSTSGVSSTSKCPPRMLGCMSRRDQATKAEIIWSLHSVNGDIVMNQMKKLGRCSMLWRSLTDFQKTLQ